MSSRTKHILWWVFAILFTLSIAVYQRLTGPTYPKRVKVELGGETYKLKLLRSCGEKNAEVKITVAPKAIGGNIVYRRLNSGEAWTETTMLRDGNNLIGYLPQQPPAGKLEYKVFLTRDLEQVAVTEEPVIIRFKGDVPAWVLVPHIFFMFMAMLFSTRSGIEALRKGEKTFNYTTITLASLVIGGAILGPLVQRYAFGAFWTGWPLGVDLTDNKTVAALVVWFIAFFQSYRNSEKRGWVIAASVVLLVVYLVPHSLLGSQLDYNTGQIVTGK